MKQRKNKINKKNGEKLSKKHEIKINQRNKYRKFERIGLIWFGLVWFYDISTVQGYLMPNPFLFI